MGKTLRVAINGYGRIGRAILRALYERNNTDLPIEVVAINGLGGLLVNAHLTQYDTTHGRFKGTVEAKDDGLLVNGKDFIRFFSTQDPSELPWKALDIDIVYECTGRLTDYESAALHLQAGAKKVLISAPAKNVDATIVYGINHQQLKEKDLHIISAASCTTNALAPIIQPIQDNIGIEEGIFTTIHAYTSDQRLLDNHHSDFYRARAATQSMIPTKTGAASMTEVIFPELKGKLKGCAIRVPTPNVSLIDFTFTASFGTNAANIKQFFEKASQNELKGILDYTEEPLVSSDFNHHPASAILLTKEIFVSDKLVKVLAWYDNEWGFSNRILDITIAWFS